MTTIGARVRLIVAIACDRNLETIADELSLYSNLKVSRLDFPDVFIAPIEDEFGLKLDLNGDLEEIANMKTVKDLVNLVTKKSKAGGL